MLNARFDWEEVNTLITLLYTKGISYLLGNDAPLNGELEHVDPIQLLRRLAACGYPLVENASISLFLLHPELASSVVEALQRTEDTIAETIAVVTLATL